MIRPLLHEVLGNVVHARIDMELLKAAVLSELEAGYSPTYRGHYWKRQHFDVLQDAALHIEAAFSLLKWLQWPEVTSRLSEPQIALPHPK